MYKLLVPYYHPDINAGGPASSVDGILNLLRTERFLIITRNTGVKGNKLDKCTELVDTERVKYIYASKFARFRLSIKDWKHSIYHINSVLDWSVVIPIMLLNLIRRTRRIVISPRGETIFLQSDRYIIKTIKNLYIKLVVRLSRENICWHSTSLEETKSLTNFGVKNPIELPNIFSVPDSYNKDKSESVNIKLLYVGRVVEHKRLLESLELLKVCENVTFSIVGPIEDEEYWREVQISKVYQDHRDRIEYLGSLSKNEVIRVMCGHHVLILLSKSENFAHVIAEALYCGMRVIKSSGVPWELPSDIALDWPFKNEDITDFLSLNNGRLHRPERSRDILMEKFDLQKLKLKYQDLYEG